MRTRMTLSPRLAADSASSAENTILPEAAPGEAGRPCASTVVLALGSSIGCNSWSSELGSIRRIASSRPMTPSSTNDTAIFNAACAVRFPVRVCSIHNLPRSTVNSMSCISRYLSSRMRRTLSNSPNTAGMTSSIAGRGDLLAALPAIVRCCGVRMPATTSSPCALTRYSP